VCLEERDWLIMPTKIAFEAAASLISLGLERVLVGDREIVGVGVGVDVDVE